MRKIYIEIETESTDPLEILKRDLAQEISCCTAYFDTENMDVNEKQTEDPERPCGEWIDEGVMADGHPQSAFRCSECGFHVVTIPNETPNFCEYCGSDNRPKDKEG